MLPIKYPIHGRSHGQVGYQEGMDAMVLPIKYPIQGRSHGCRVGRTTPLLKNSPVINRCLTIIIDTHAMLPLRVIEMDGPG